METATAGDRPTYETPEVVTYGDEEILSQLGPAQAQYSKPTSGGGGGII